MISKKFLTFGHYIVLKMYIFVFELYFLNWSFRSDYNSHFQTAYNSL